MFGESPSSLQTRTRGAWGLIYKSAVDMPSQRIYISIVKPSPISNTDAMSNKSNVFIFPFLESRMPNMISVLFYYDDLNS